MGSRLRRMRLAASIPVTPSRSTVMPNAFSAHHGQASRRVGVRPHSILRPAATILRWWSRSASRSSRRSIRCRFICPPLFMSGSLRGRPCTPAGGQRLPFFASRGSMGRWRWRRLLIEQDLSRGMCICPILHPVASICSTFVALLHAGASPSVMFWARARAGQGPSSTTPDCAMPSPTFFIGPIVLPWESAMAAR